MIRSGELGVTGKMTAIILEKMKNKPLLFGLG